jgi:uncharacterized protein YegL
MEGSKLDACKTALREIYQFVVRDPLVNDKVRISVISFSDSAEVLLPLSKMTDVVDFPVFVVKGGSNYESAFTCLKQTIQTDIANLKNKGCANIQQPIVFFISDGEPTDTNWQAAHAAVADKNWSFSPHIIAFGVGGARVEIIRTVATGKASSSFAYFADDNADPGAVLHEVFKSLLSSLIASGPNQKPIVLNVPRDDFYLVPVYLVIDESAALDQRLIHAINHHLPEIHKAILCDPLMNESVRLCVISYSDSAEVLLPLSNLSEVEEFPGLVAKGSANYQELFLSLQRVLADDLSMLPQPVKHYARPIVFIIAASNPTDESWREPHADLLNDPRFHVPHLVVLGAGESSASTMTDIATTSPMHHHRMAYRLTETSQPSDLIRESLKTLYFGSSQQTRDW